MTDTVERQQKTSHPRTRALTRSAGNKRSVFLIVIVAMLVTIGLGAMLSASSVVSIRASSDQFDLFLRQVMWVGLGLSAMVISTFVPYRFWLRLALPLFIATVIGLIVTLVIGDARNGAVRWIEVGPVTVQVAEFAKFTTLALLAAALTKKAALLGDLRHVLAPVGAILGITTVLLLAQPDFGNVLLIVVPAFVMLAASTVPLRHVFGLGAIGARSMTALAMSAD